MSHRLKKYQTWLFSYLAHHALLVSFLFCVFIGLMMLVFRLALVYSYTYDLGGVENTFIYSIQKMLIGKPLYTSPEDFNFDITQYSPIFYYINYAFCYILNLQAGEDLISIYRLGRILVLFINIATVGLIHLLATKQLGVNRFVGIAVAIVAFVYLTANSMAVKADALFHFFFLLCAYYFIEYLAYSTIKNLLCACFLAVTSIFVKQSGIQLPIMLISFLFITFRWKDFGLAISFTLIGIIIYGGVFWYIYGFDFWQNTFGGVVTKINWLEYYKLLANHVFPNFQVLFVIAIFLCLLCLAPSSTAQEKFLAYLLLTSFVFAALTATRRGAGGNYFSDFVHITLIALAYFAQKYISQLKLYVPNISKYANLLLLSCCIAFLPFKLANNYFHLSYFGQSYRDDYQKAIEVAKFMEREFIKYPNTYFFSFNAHLNNLLVKNSLLPNNDMVYFGVIYSYQKFAQAVENKKLRYIVLQAGNAPTAYQGADFSKYILLKEVAGFSIFVLP